MYSRPANDKAWHCVSAKALGYNGHAMRGRLFLTLLLVTALLLPAGIQAQDSPQSLLQGQRSFTRGFGARQVATELKFSTTGNFEAGQRSHLLIDLDSALSGALERELAGAVVVNGFVVIGLPPGLEPDGEPRLFYYDSQKNRYEFMYSKAYPNLTRLEGLGDAMEAAASNDPQRILDGLSRINTALDPTVELIPPTDARLSGADPSYSVSGVSWLIPCNVWFDSLVNLFDPEDSAEQNPRLRVSLPVKVAGQISEPKVALYVGGLSAAVAKVELLPADIPATAIPLAPLPEPPAAAAAESEATSLVSPEASGTPDSTPPNNGDARSGAGDNRPRRPSQADNPDDPAAVQNPAQRTPPAADPETAPPPPPPPAPIPVLIYSYEWLAWETTVDISNVLGLELAAPVFLDAAAEATGIGVSVAPADTGAAQLTELPALPDSAESEAPLTTPVDVVTAPAAPQDEIESEQVREQQDMAGETAESLSTQPAEAPVNSIEQTPGVREVEPGTLPEVQETYTVALKPITGADSGSPGAQGSSVPDGVPEFRASDGRPALGVDDAAGTPPSAIDGTPAGAISVGPPPEDMGEMVLVPEGYFLMGTGGTTSAGDADELPQQQVYLPAYYIDKYPVTNRQFMEFVLRAGYKPSGGWDKYYTPGTADLPVRGVTWDDATAYAQWANKRLPTEAEWEKAARGADGRTYPWGEDWSADILPRGEVLYEIMTKPECASPYGVFGSCGLVWQWTASAFAAYPFNPDARGDKRVLRGGCYSNGRNVVRCANRYAEAPNVALNTFGFRCVKDAQ